MGFASASEIRRNIDGGILPKEDLPKETSETLEKLLLQGKAPAKIENLERMLIGFFRNAEAEELKEYYAVTEGAENRIIAAAKTATSIEDFYEKVKTKRYTMATVRRMICLLYTSNSTYEPQRPQLSPARFHP